MTRRRGLGSWLQLCLDERYQCLQPNSNFRINLDLHPCLADRDGDLILDLIDPDPDQKNVGFTPIDDSFGLCGHRWDSEQKTYDFSI